MNESAKSHSRWYDGLTRYQWVVLTIASLGWIFDVFEGQIFVASMNEAMKSLLPEDTGTGQIAYYNNVALGAFLLGGALGGIVFGMVSDRIGRTRTMVLTILMYSCFTCVTALAQTWWQMALLRFLVAMGIGGEWAVASAMVAEVFPPRARAWSLGIFHASSVLGTYLAILAGWLIVGNDSLGWRWGFAIGAFPALLTLWVRWRLHEPERWQQARAVAREDPTQQTGRLRDLFSPGLRRHTVVGVALAAIGMATFWGVHIYGKDLIRAAAEREVLGDLPAGADANEQQVALSANFESIKRMEMIGMFLVTTGGGFGLIAFAPICERLGRRGAFLLYHLGGLVSALVLFQALPGTDAPVLWLALPIFGFLTLGMHAGYAIYFPELFPTRLRGTGGGFCFNGGRILAAPILILRGTLRNNLGFTLEDAASILSLLFALGLLVLWYAPETRGRELPE